MSVLERQMMEASLSDEQHRVFSGPARKKILFVTRIYEFGGAERHLIDLIRRMREPGLQLSILCIGTDCYGERLSPDLGVRVIKRKGMSYIAGMGSFRGSDPLAPGWLASGDVFRSSTLFSQDPRNQVRSAAWSGKCWAP